MAVGLGKIAKHAPAGRIELFPSNPTSLQRASNRSNNLWASLCPKVRNCLDCDVLGRGSNGPLPVQPAGGSTTCICV